MDDLTAATASSIETTDEFVIVVTFDLHPGAHAEFMPLMLRNAEKSRLTERGCRRFDVLEQIGVKDRIVLYEFYDSQADFDDHCLRPHFLSFDAETRPMVRAKSFIQYRNYKTSRPE